MNERIRELADEAAKFSAVMALPTGESGDKLFVEKFAELIVRECAYVSEGYFGFKDHTPGTAIAKEMKQHFGIDIEEDIDETCPRCGETDSGTSCGIPDCGWVTGVEE